MARLHVIESTAFFAYKLYDLHSISFPWKCAFYAQGDEVRLGLID